MDSVLIDEAKSTFDYFPDSPEKSTKLYELYDILALTAGKREKSPPSFPRSMRFWERKLKKPETLSLMRGKKTVNLTQQGVEKVEEYSIFKTLRMQKSGNPARHYPGFKSA